MVADVSERSPQGVIETFTGVVVNVLVAVLIWVLGAYVFLPQAPRTAEAFGITEQVVSAIVLVAALLAVVRVFLSVRDLSGALAIRAFGHREEGHRGRIITRAGFYLIFGLAAYGLLYLLGTLYTPLRGIALAVLAIWAILFLFHIGDTFSRSTDRATQLVWRAFGRVAQ